MSRGWSQYRQEVAEQIPRRFQGLVRTGPAPAQLWRSPRPGSLIIGLAPAAQGGNRTGRMFTGDRSGDWLFEALHRFGFANQPTFGNSRRRPDFKGLLYYGYDPLRPASEQAAARGDSGLPPLLPAGTGPAETGSDIHSFGRSGFQSALKKPAPERANAAGAEIRHGQVFPLPDDRTIIASYHPSQQNTFTGKLTREMFHRVFEMAREQSGESFAEVIRNRETILNFPQQ